MRILLVNHEYPPIGGGSAVATKHLAEALVLRGDQVLVLTAAPESKRTIENGVEIQTIPVPLKAGKLASIGFWLSFFRKAPKALKQVIEEFQPEVINSHFLFPSSYVVARTKTKIPHVASTVGADVHDPTRKIIAIDKNPLMRSFAKRVTRHACVLTTPSSDMAARIDQVFGSNVNVATIPWPVPPMQADPRSRSDLKIDADRFVISTLCRLVRRKRIDILMQAVAELTDVNPLLIIMGFGPQEQELRTLAESLGISANVLFTGKVSEADKAAYLQHSDVFSLASEHEAFGLVFVEAMSLGIPVVATNVGGQTDIVRAGVDGFLFPPGDVQALASTLRKLSTDKGLLSKLQEEAKNRATAYTPDSVAQEFQALFQRAVAQKST